MALRIGDGQIIREPSAAHAVQAPTTRASATARTEPGEPSPFARVLSGLGKEVDRGERTMNHVIQGGGNGLGSDDLLALQAQVYRYSEAVDLAAKLVDRVTSGVKTVLQNQ